MKLIKTILYNLLQVLVAIDQLLNVVICMILCPTKKVWADETLSAKSYRLSLKSKRWNVIKEIIDTLFLRRLFYKEGHCKSCYENEIARIHLPPSMRDNLKGKE